MRFSLLLSAIWATFALSAVEVRNLDEGSHLSGPKLQAKDLEGRVIAVEEWGWQCPPCKASLPHMAALAKELAKDARVVFIGAHVQARREDEIRGLLKANGCDYPVYQGFGVVGAPSSSGIPHAYVINHRGETVWSGNPLADLKGFRKAIETAAKAVPKPIPGSLVNGMELTACKDMARRLVAGYNVEGALRQLQARIARGGTMAEEAKAIMARCEEWAETMRGEIEANLESKPSKALAAGQLYLRTFPSRAADLRATLTQAAKDPLTARLAASRQALEKLRQANAATANARKALLGRVNLQLRQLGTFAVEAGNEDFADVKALWEAYAAELRSESKE